ncbi:MAG: ribosome biogenesis protein [Nitrososphaeria archaeon]
MTKITFILAESALETIPKEITSDRIVQSFCNKRGKSSKNVLLDQSYHHKAILKLEEHQKRGRPDIVHLCLLEATSIPLYFEKKLDVYIHTINDKIINVGSNVRLPRVYERFVGLIENLYQKRTVKAEDKLLLKLQDGNLDNLINRIRPSVTIGLSRVGKTSTYEDVAKIGLKFEKPVFIVGGFAKGTFSEKSKRSMNYLLSVSQYPLDAHVVTARILYEIEKQLKNNYNKQNKR